MLQLTTDKHEASRGLSATAELLVKARVAAATDSQYVYNFWKCANWCCLPKLSQEAQLSQWGRAMLRVIEYFAKSLKITEDQSKGHS